MKRKPNVSYRYHHMGVPISEQRPGEHYSSTFRMYKSGGEDSGFSFIALPPAAACTH